jgi:hypothetical protein
LNLHKRLLKSRKLGLRPNPHLRKANVRQRKFMMTIYFKNGMTKEVIEQIGEAINKRVIEGCGKFQTFSDENGNLLLIVNLDEVVYVA